MVLVGRSDWRRRGRQRNRCRGILIRRRWALPRAWIGGTWSAGDADRDGWTDGGVEQPVVVVVVDVDVDVRWTTRTGRLVGVGPRAEGRPDAAAAGRRRGSMIAEVVRVGQQQVVIIVVAMATLMREMRMV